MGLALFGFNNLTGCLFLLDHYIWDQLFPAEQTRIVRLLVEKVIVSPNDLEVRLRANGIERLVLELKPDNAKPTREEALA